MEDNTKPEEEIQKDNLTEFEKESPKKKEQNVGLQVVFGLFFIGYGIFRLTNTTSGDGAWNTFFGWALIITGSIRLVASMVK